MHARVVLGVGKGVLFREVSSVRSVLIEREVPMCFLHLTGRYANQLHFVDDRQTILPPSHSPSIPAEPV